MFLNLGRIYSTSEGGLHRVQSLPASQLSRWLEEIWYHSSLDDDGFPDGTGFGRDVEAIRAALGHPQAAFGAEHGMAPSGLAPQDIGTPAPFTLREGPLDQPDCGPRIWQHLIYAYLVESSGAFDIMAEVARRLVAGEALGVLSRESIVWLRNTEELFFRDPPLFGVSGVVSDLRPSAASNRRNAYWRLFGMDLPHQIPQGWPGSRQPEDWKANTGPGVNTDFQEKLIDLLRQVWIGIVNAQNTTGANPTDPGYVSLLCKSIGDLLRNRRQRGLLAREEFVYVATMSWFHLTLLDGGAGNLDAPIVRDLQAQGTAPEQRLNNLALKVGMKPAARSRELFQLSELMSVLLRSIELGLYDEPDQAELLYSPPQGPIAKDMRLIINLWQSATGQRIKDKDAVTPATMSTQPLRVPAPAGSLAGQPPATNGSSSGGR